MTNNLSDLSLSKQKRQHSWRFTGDIPALLEYSQREQKDHSKLVAEFREFFDMNDKSLDPEKLRKFLLSENLISSIDYPEPSSTGSNYWLFSGNTDVYTEGLEKALADKKLAHYENIPIVKSARDDVGLLTRAFFVERTNNQNKRLCLEVMTSVYFNGIDSVLPYLKQDALGAIYTVLDDLKTEIHGKDSDKIQLIMDNNFGRGHYNLDGINLRPSDYPNYRWIQTNILPIFKEIFENEHMETALYVSASFEGLNPSLGYKRFNPHEELFSGNHPIQKEINNYLMHGFSELIDYSKNEFYTSNLKAGANDLRENPDVVKLLKMI